LKVIFQNAEKKGSVPIILHPQINFEKKRHSQNQRIFEILRVEFDGKIDPKSNQNVAREIPGKLLGPPWGLLRAGAGQFLDATRNR